ncbi:hypothetical protein SEUCBS139899_003572 [Sporothrix eucalyptigena]|uniref:Kinetochore protein fta4 n=1 Tax=Sporothrix eucalyptigena TaxID=1812306 RepID=A0ABP0B652_9PEZI
MDPPTVIALKQAFLELATRQLAQPVAPSRAWQRRNDSKGSGHGDGGADDAGRRIPRSVVDDVLSRTNQLMLLHARRTHTPTAVRHVAEQLDQLYQTAGDQLGATPEDPNNEALDRGMDYTTTSAIFGLPSTWDDPRDASALPLEAHRYAKQLTELQALTEQRATTAARVRQLREMVSVLEGVSSARFPVQRSLVTRDGPVETELERMRVLLARVGDRVSSLPSLVAIYQDTDADSIPDVEEVGRQRAQALLGLM